MTKKTSEGARAKRAENRVSKYLWGDDHLRDWKDKQDVSGLDAYGQMWKGEVKNWAWPAGPQRMWKILSDALEQAEKSSTIDGRAFACFIPKGCETEHALVLAELPAMEFEDGAPYWGGPLVLQVLTLRMFRHWFFTLTEP